MHLDGSPPKGPSMPYSTSAPGQPVDIAPLMHWLETEVVHISRKLDVLLTMNPAGSICSACARSKGVNGYQESEALSAQSPSLLLEMVKEETKEVTRAAPKVTPAIAKMVGDLSPCPEDADQIRNGYVRPTVETSPATGQNGNRHGNESNHNSYTYTSGSMSDLDSPAWFPSRLARLPHRDEAPSPGLPRDQGSMSLSCILAGGPGVLQTGQSFLSSSAAPQTLRHQRKPERAITAASGMNSVATSTHARVPPTLMADGRILYARTSSLSEQLDEVQRMLKREHRKQGIWARKVWKFLDDPESSLASWAYANFLNAFTLSAAVYTLLQTMTDPPVTGMKAAGVEIGFDLVFVIDIVARFIVCPSRPSFFFQMYNIIDVLASSALILRLSAGPDGMTDLSAKDDVRAFVLICIVPVLRMLKVLRDFQKFHLLSTAFSSVFESLPVLIFVLVVIVLTFGSVLFVVENFETLPLAIYFTIVTVSTVGYGDITPETNLGKVIVSLLIFIGILFMAMPIGIVGHSFTQVWQSRDRILLMHRVRARLKLWGYTARDIYVLFNHFDMDDNGELDLGEFRKMMKLLNMGIKDERVIQLFKSFDVDDNGTIDVKEFLRNLLPTEFHEIFGTGPVGESRGQRIRSTFMDALPSALPWAGATWHGFWGWDAERDDTSITRPETSGSQSIFRKNPTQSESQGPPAFKRARSSSADF